MVDEIDTDMDIIDSRDVIARIAELAACRSELDGWETQELTMLTRLVDECRGASDWEHGVTLIRGSHFEEHARQFAEEIGAIDREGGWPAIHIDWEAAARDLKQDYMRVDFDGVEYWVR